VNTAEEILEEGAKLAAEAEKTIQVC